MLKEKISDLHGLLVVAQEEAAQVGTVEDVFVDTERCALAARTIRPRGLRKQRLLPADAITVLGRDVVFISSESAVVDMPEGGPPGRDVKALQGAWVTTLQGAHLGRLVDLDVRSRDWAVAELRLTDGKLLPITAEQLTIGPDELIVPAHCGDMISDAPPQKRGLLARVFGTERVSETEGLIGRVSRARKKHADKEDEEAGEDA